MGGQNNSFKGFGIHFLPFLRMHIETTYLTFGEGVNKGSVIPSRDGERDSKSSDAPWRRQKKIPQVSYETGKKLF